MSNVEAPNINSGDTNNPDLLAEQSGTPNMSSSKTFTVDTNMQVNGDLGVTGTVTATSFVGDGSQLTGITGASTNDSGPQSEIISGECFVRIEEGSVTGSDVGPSEPKQVSVGGNDLWDVEFSMGNDFQVEAGDDIDLEAEDKIYLTAGGKIDLESTDYIELNSEVRMTGDAIAEGTVTATAFVGDGSQLTGISGGTGGGLDSAAVTLLVDSGYVQARETPQDFAYSSLTGAPTALSSFTNDTSYITASDIPTTVDSDYVQARVTLDGVGLDSAGVTALVDSDYVALRAPAASGGLDSAAVLATVGIDSSSISLGALSDPSSYTDTIAIGHKARASGTGSTGRTIAIGFEARTSSNMSTAVGANTFAKNQSTTAVGVGSTADGQQSTAIGAYCDAEYYGFAAGRNSNATGSGGVAIGNTANANGTDIISIGSSAGAGASKSSPYGICIGATAGGKGFLTEAIMIGKSAGYASLASQAGEKSIAIGSNAGVGSGSNTISLGEYAGYWNTQGNYTNNAIFINASGSTGQVRKIQDHYAIDIRTNDSDGHLWFSKDSDWNFGSGVTMTDLTASGATVVFSDLPTTDPVNAGQLWNDNGTLKVSAG